jgi:type I restriction enzyme S subunit
MNEMTLVGDLVAEGALLVEDGNHGEYRPRPHEFSDDGTPFIRAADMTTGVVTFATAGRIDPTARARIRKGVGQPGDTLLSHKGTVGKVAVAPMDSPDYVCSPQTTFWRSTDPTRIEGRYLPYVLKSPAFRAQLNYLMGQTDMAPYVSLTDQRAMSIPVPPIDVQRGIAEVLGALDDKIAANAKLSVAADELSRLTFESLLAGGQTVPLSSLARFVNGKAFTKDASGTGRVVIRIAELNSGPGGSTVYNDIDVADDHLARPGDLLFAWSGSLTVHRWYRDEGIVNQHIFKVIPTEKPMWVVKGALDRKLAEFRAVAADKATTMGHIQRRHLDEPVAIPAAGQIEAHGGAMGGLWSRALSAEQESLRLEQMRDGLLPQLMSGKIRVKDAERVVEGIV